MIAVQISWANTPVGLLVTGLAYSKCKLMLASRDNNKCTSCFLLQCHRPSHTPLGVLCGPLACAPSSGWTSSPSVNSHCFSNPIHSSCDIVSIFFRKPFYQDWLHVFFLAPRSALPGHLPGHPPLCTVIPQLSCESHETSTCLIWICRMPSERKVAFWVEEPSPQEASSWLLKNRHMTIP